MKQSEIFSETEGDAWYERNVLKDRWSNDPVLRITQELGITPIRILEYGCADGVRLAAYKSLYPRCVGIGVDPSRAAVADGKIKTGVGLRIGRAVDTFISPGTANLIIYGFCLYVCDPEDYFAIASVGDAQLADEGHLVIHDFLPDHSHSVAYKHDTRITTRKMDFSKLWLAHPNYTLVRQERFPDGTGVSVLKKDTAIGFPMETLLDD